MSGRICALADVFDGLTTTRPYKAAMDEIEGLRLIQESSDKLFDSRLVRVFVDRFSDILKSRQNIK